MFWLMKLLGDRGWEHGLNPSGLFFSLPAPITLWWWLIVFRCRWERMGVPQVHILGALHLQIKEATCFQHLGRNPRESLWLAHSGLHVFMNPINHYGQGLCP